MAGVLCALALAFGIAAIFVPAFRQEGAIIVGAILGPLVTLIGSAFAVYAGRRSDRKKQPEKPEEDEE